MEIKTILCPECEGELESGLVSFGTAIGWDDEKTPKRGFLSEQAWPHTVQENLSKTHIRGIRYRNGKKCKNWGLVIFFPKEAV